jgi:hypothetical protein
MRKRRCPNSSNRLVTLHLAFASNTPKRAEPMKWMRTKIFRFWENRKARNWGLTIGFVLVVPVGARFAGFAWTYGNLADRVAVIVAGTAIGVISTVVLCRIWQVPPLQTMPADDHRTAKLPTRPPAGPEFLAASQFAHSRSARNKNFAREAAALGPARRARF